MWAWPGPRRAAGLPRAMSQRKRSKGLGSSQADDGEEDFALTHTPTPTQVQRSLARRPQDQVNQKVSELVQFLLVKDQKKIPIKRADILKKVIREYRDIYSEILSRAGRTLQQVFGLRLVEIDTKHHIYILTSDLPRAEQENLRQDNQTPKLGLLIVILSFIFMKGNSVKDGAVWEFLRRLRLQPGERHEVFGDVKKLVTEEFVRQKYLEIIPIPLTDPPEFQYQWGPRAAKETSKRDVLRFVAKIQGKDPTFWMSQYNEAKATS
ncbi:non-structural maintenance of chromosomes element 3 homolog [Cuculus canorus]|uniref:non-structural maintenance of chromosomes element 3 homolog n=1 Tax=Cuculus canorus TaxID=55661 RepID=UPI0023AB51BC|nr:non-structural maintenance of chromosomes element 3 homolog [Cuculus canorus]